MTYALRMWVEDQQTLHEESPDAEAMLARFREIIATPTTKRFAVTVNAEPGPYPERSWTIAKYQS